MLPVRLRLSDDNIGRALLIAFAAVGLAAVAGSVWAAAHLESQLHTHRDFHAPALEAIQALDSRVKETIQESFAYLATGDPEEKAEYRHLLESFESDAERFRQIARLDQPGEESEREMFDRIVASTREVTSLAEDMFESLEREGSVARPQLAAYEEVVERLNGELALLVASESAEVRAEHEQVEKTVGHTARGVVAIGVMTFALALLFGRGVGSAIARHSAELRRAERDRHRLELRMVERQKLETIGVLAGGIAHDFNNLLVGIGANAEVAVAATEHGSPAQIALESIQEASARAADLTRELLAYAGKTTVQAEPLELSGLVEGTLGLLRRNVPETARCQSDFAGEALWFDGDATQIRQVAMNLITNAADALREGSGALRVSTGSVEAKPSDPNPARVLQVPEAGDYVFFEVADTGSGIDPETLEKIFDPFFTTKDGGRGLGLAALLGIARTHRGGVEVSSEPSRGTVFRILLPRRRAPRQPVETPRIPERPESTGNTVLVVDDQDLVARATARLLGMMGFETLIASGGREALDVLSERGAGIAGVVLDLTMPDLDGKTTFRELRSIRSDLPVVFYSGHAEGENGWITEHDHTAFLEKPFTADSLVAKLREVGL